METVELKGFLCTADGWQAWTRTMRVEASAKDSNLEIALRAARIAKASGSVAGRGAIDVRTVNGKNWVRPIEVPHA